MMHTRRFSAPGLLLVAALGVCGCTAGPAAAMRTVHDVPSPTTVPAPVIVTIGDSVMAGEGLAEDEAWPALIGEQTGADITNLGCSGAGFVAIGVCGTDFSGLVAQAAALDPTVVVIQSSDNDAPEATADIDDDTTAAVQAIRAALPHATIVGLSTLWTQPAPAPATIAAASTALRGAVTAVHGTFVDIGQPLTGQAGLLQPDDEHPTAAGQQVLASTITAALRGAGVAL